MENFKELIETKDISIVLRKDFFDIMRKIDYSNGSVYLRRNNQQFYTFYYAVNICRDFLLNEELYSMGGKTHLL